MSSFSGHHLIWHPFQVSGRAGPVAKTRQTGFLHHPWTCTGKVSSTSDYQKMLFYTNVIQVCVHPLVFDMQRSPGWSRPDWCLHGLWCCLHHHHGTIQVNMMISFSNIMLLCSISNGYVGSTCMMSAPQVRQLSLDSSVQHFNIISSDCSIWRRSDCSFFDGGSAWPWPWQRGLPLQLLRHAHLVLQALQQLLEMWHPFFFGSFSFFWSSWTSYWKFKVSFCHGSGIFKFEKKRRWRKCFKIEVCFGATGAKVWNPTPVISLVWAAPDKDSFLLGTAGKYLSKRFRFGLQSKYVTCYL